MVGTAFLPTMLGLAWACMLGGGGMVARFLWRERRRPPGPRVFIPAQRPPGD